MNASEFIKKATDPGQYDSEDMTWEKEGKPTATRTLFVREYLEPYAPRWKGQDILDIGAGTGWLVNWATEAGAKSAIGIEPSKKLYGLAKRGFPNIELKNLPLRDYETSRQFDSIFAVLSLSHLEKIQEALRKIAGLLRASGTFISIVPDYDYFRTPRHSYQVNVTDISPEEYVASTTRGTSTMADIIRQPKIYIKAAVSSGLKLIRQTPMTPTALQISRAPKYEAYKNTPICQLLEFTKAK